MSVLNSIKLILGTGVSLRLYFNKTCLACLFISLEDKMTSLGFIVVCSFVVFLAYWDASYIIKKTVICNEPAFPFKSPGSR